MSHTRSRPHALFLMVAILVLGACDSGLVSTGIDGTGMARGREIVSVGRVRSLGSIEVNGVRFDTTGATFTIDGSSGGQADLEVGDVVLVEGTLNSGEITAVAQRVVADHVLQGAIDAIDAANGSFLALGQRVHVSANTSFATALANGLGALAVGDRINVSGFRNLHGVIEATRIDRQASGVALKTTGAVTDVAADGRHLSINDLVVDYGTAQWIPANGRDTFTRGDVVEVKGTAPAGGGPFVAASVQLKSKRIAGAADRLAHVEGYLTALDPDDARRIEVNGIAVSSTATTTFDGTVTVDAPIAVKGTVDTGGGVVATSVNALPFPQVGPKAGIQGRIFDAISGPVADVLVNAYVQTQLYGYSYQFVNGPLMTAQDGRFTSNPIESTSLMNLYAHKTGYVQPCAVFVDGNNAMNIEVELVAESTLDAFNPPPPMSALGAITVTGKVYETTPGGRLPVVGARLWFGDSMGITYATTVTDRSGNYIACGLPHDSRWTRVWGNELWAQKDGFQDSVIDAIDASHSNVIDIEMKRK